MVMELKQDLLFGISLWIPLPSVYHSNKKHKLTVLNIIMDLFYIKRNLIVMMVFLKLTFTLILLVLLFLHSDSIMLITSMLLNWITLIKRKLPLLKKLKEWDQPLKNMITSLTLVYGIDSKLFSINQIFKYIFKLDKREI